MPYTKHDPGTNALMGLYEHPMVQPDGSALAPLFLPDDDPEVIAFREASAQALAARFAPPNP